MAKPEASAAALELYEALDPAFTRADPDNDYACLKVCMALVAGKIDQLHGYLVDDVEDRPPWAVIFDPLKAPVEALPYLAQFSGAVLRPEMDEATKRATIQTPEAFSRGRIASIEAVVKRRLTGTKTVIVTERYTGSAWRLRVEALEAETPEPAETEADLRREQKPIGIVLFFNTRVIWDWGEAKESVEHPTWKDVAEDFTTWMAYRTNEP